MMWSVGIPCCEEKKHEYSQAVKIVKEMVIDTMYKICEVDGVEKQISMMMQLFQFLGKVKSLEDAAQKLTSLAMSADIKTVAEDKKEDKPTGPLEWLYL